jgi:hypothetical protein
VQARGDELFGHVAQRRADGRRIQHQPSERGLGNDCGAEWPSKLNGEKPSEIGVREVTDRAPAVPTEWYVHVERKLRRPLRARLRQE